MATLSTNPTSVVVINDPNLNRLGKGSLRFTAPPH